MRRKLAVVSIDDDSSDSELLRRALLDTDELELSFRAFDDPVKGQVEILRAPPDLLFLDLLMEPRSGLDTLIALRRRGFDGPIVMVTGCQRTDLAVECLKEGATDFISKDALTPDELLRTLHIALEKEQVTRAVDEQRRTLAATNRELERCNVSLRRVHAILREELNIPLDAVDEFVGILESGGAGALTPEQLDCFDMIREGCSQLRLKLDEMSDLVSLEAGDLELDEVEVDPGTLLRNAARTIAPLAERRGIALRLFLEHDLPRVILDERRIEQIVTGLLRGAVAFTPLGGEITVRGHRSSGPEEAFEIEIVDSDSRISEAEIETLLETRGAGIGSSFRVSRKIVALHGGRIGAERNGESGVRYRLILPSGGSRAKSTVVDTGSPSVPQEVW